MELLSFTYIGICIVIFKFDLHGSILETWHNESMQIFFQAQYILVLCSLYNFDKVFIVYYAASNYVNAKGSVLVFWITYKNIKFYYQWSCITCIPV